MIPNSWCSHPVRSPSLEGGHDLRLAFIQQNMTEVKGFCRCHWGPKSLDSELNQKEMRAASTQEPAKNQGPQSHHHQEMNYANMSLKVDSLPQSSLQVRVHLCQHLECSFVGPWAEHLPKLCVDFSTHRNWSPDYKLFFLRMVLPLGFYIAELNLVTRNSFPFFACLTPLLKSLFLRVCP